MEPCESAVSLVVSSLRSHSAAVIDIFSTRNTMDGADLKPRSDLHGERFQTSTNRQPLAVSATAPPMSQPTLRALAIAAGTGTEMFCRMSESIGSSQICLGSIRWIVK